MGKQQNAILGFDIGGTKTTIVVGTYEGEILHRASFPTAPEREFSLSFNTICKGAEKSIEVIRESIGTRATESRFK